VVVFDVYAEEFADVDFNEERLEKRFRRTMETLSKNPRKSIYGSSANRAEAKAIYNLWGRCGVIPRRRGKRKSRRTEGSLALERGGRLSPL
jgi:hypothetical protein